jgi:hypothetical protein
MQYKYVQMYLFESIVFKVQYIQDSVCIQYTFKRHFKYTIQINTMCKCSLLKDPTGSQFRSQTGRNHPHDTLHLHLMAPPRHEYFHSWYLRRPTSQYSPHKVTGVYGVLSPAGESSMVYWAQRASLRLRFNQPAGRVPYHRTSALSLRSQPALVPTGDEAKAMQITARWTKGAISTRTKGRCLYDKKSRIFSDGIQNDSKHAASHTIAFSFCKTVPLATSTQENQSENQSEKPSEKPSWCVLMCLDGSCDMRLWVQEVHVDQSQNCIGIGRDEHLEDRRSEIGMEGFDPKWSPLRILMILGFQIVKSYHFFPFRIEHCCDV